MDNNLSIDEMLDKYRSEKVKNSKAEKYNTIIKHTRMEQLIYNDKKKKIDEMYKDIDYTIESIEKKGQEKLETFPYLSQDLFNLFYKFNANIREDEQLYDNVKRFNKKIIKKVIENPDYTSLKLLTEGKDLESIEGAREFVKYLYDNLDDMLKDIGGDPGTINNIEKQKKALDNKKNQLQQAIELYKKMKKKGKSDEELKNIANNIKALNMQVSRIQKNIKGFEEEIEMHTRNNLNKIEKQINQGMKRALQKVHEVRDTLDAWGGGEDQPETIEGKSELIKKVNANPKFREMAKYLGRLRRLAKSKMKSSFIKGRGEKVGIELGNDLDRVLTSEFALLSNKETEVLFYKKFAEKKLLQYKEMRKETKGRGPVIFIADESGSTKGGKEYWQKALAVATLEMAIADDRNFAYIPFAGNIGKIIEVNKGNFTEDIVFEIANNFMNGGDTQFSPPIKKAMEILEKEEFEKADVIFSTDGHSNIHPKVLEKFNNYRKNKKTKCIGILLDKGGYSSVSDYTLKQFTDKIYKTSELSETEIAEEVISGVI